jgi:hypothetical protein
LWSGRQRLCVDDLAIGRQRVMQCAQDVDHALNWNASQRPAAQGDVEPLSPNVQGSGIMHGEFDAPCLLSRERRVRPRDALFIRVECIDVLRNVGCEGRESTFPTADVDHTGSFESHERCDRARFRSCFVAPMHLRADSLDRRSTRAELLRFPACVFELRPRVRVDELAGLDLLEPVSP